MCSTTPVALLALQYCGRTVTGSPARRSRSVALLHVRDHQHLVEIATRASSGFSRSGPDLLAGERRRAPPPCPRDGAHPEEVVALAGTARLRCLPRAAFSASSASLELRLAPPARPSPAWPSARSSSLARSTRRCRTATSARAASARDRDPRTRRAHREEPVACFTRRPRRTRPSPRARRAARPRRRCASSRSTRPARAAARGRAPAGPRRARRTSTEARRPRAVALPVTSSARLRRRWSRASSASAAKVQPPPGRRAKGPQRRGYRCEGSLEAHWVLEEGERRRAVGRSARGARRSSSGRWKSVRFQVRSSVQQQLGELNDGPAAGPEGAAPRLTAADSRSTTPSASGSVSSRAAPAGLDGLSWG